MPDVNPFYEEEIMPSLEVNSIFSYLLVMGIITMMLVVVANESLKIKEDISKAQASSENH